MASYKDIVKLTGLSLGTVSNVIQGKDSVKEENKEKVYQAMKKLGYRVDYQARGLAGGESNLIGLILGNLGNESETEIMTLMEDFADRNGYRLLMSTSRNDSNREKDNCEAMLSSKVDGLFIFFGSLENEAYFRKLEKTEKTPIVFLARYLDNCSIPYVAVDNRYAAKCMVEYVYAKGHRKLTYIDTSGGAMLSPMRDRRKGVEAECEKIGIEYQVYKFPAQKDDIEAGYNAGEALIREGNIPSLVFCRNDSIAVGFYNACMRYGIRIPEDVSLMGFGGFYSDKITPKRLTTYDRCFSTVIKTATEVYTRIHAARREGRAEDDILKKIFIKGKIIEGETVAEINREA